MITNFKIFEDKRQLKKINFEWSNENGDIFKFKNISVYANYDYVPMAGVSQVIRQYIKQKWKIPFQISSDSFSGGDSITVYLSPVKVEENVAKDVEIELKLIFTSGSFDGSDDSYNYKPTVFKISDGGKEYSFRTKFLSVNYEPKYGTKDWDAYLKWKEFRETTNKFNL